MRRSQIMFFIVLVLSAILFTCMVRNNKVEIQYGKSAIYSKREMDDAIKLIVKEMAEWDGCELRQVSYAGDDTSIEALAYCNQLAKEKLNDECIVFSSSFSTSKRSQSAGSFEPDSLYEDWLWYLARRNGEMWEIITYGY